jgi:hypothetical protein
MKSLTVNQTITLLDMRRGFEASRHLGTMDSDLAHLHARGYIVSSENPTLTNAGEALVDRILAVTRGGV